MEEKFVRIYMYDLKGVLMVRFEVFTDDILILEVINEYLGKLHFAENNEGMFKINLKEDLLDAGAHGVTDFFIPHESKEEYISSWDYEIIKD